MAAGKLLRLSLSAGVGHFVPGTFLERTTSGAPYTYAYVMTTYAF